SEFEPQCHVFRTKQLRKPRPCHLCHQAVIKQASCCRVCKYICHKSCEDKVSKQTLFKQTPSLNISAEREGQLDRPSSIRALARTRRASPDPCTGSGSYFLVLKRICRAPRARPTKRPRTRGDPSVEFFHPRARVSDPAGTNAKREGATPWRRSYLHATDGARPMRFSVPRSLCRCYEHTEDSATNLCARSCKRIDRDRVDSLSFSLCVKHTVWVQSPSRARALLALPCLALPSSYLEVLLCFTLAPTHVHAADGTVAWSYL
ncbi:unnamed protein product, partial [Heterotrigona itama]